VPDYGCAYQIIKLFGYGEKIKHHTYRDCGIDSCYAHALKLRLSGSAEDAVSTAVRYADSGFPECSLFGSESEGIASGGFASGGIGSGNYADGLRETFPDGSLRCAAVIGAALAGIRGI